MVSDGLGGHQVSLNLLIFITPSRSDRWPCHPRPAHSFPEDGPPTGRSLLGDVGAAEGCRQNLVRSKDAVAYQPLNAVHHRSGLARAGYGKDQRWAMCMIYDGLLLFGQGQRHAGDCITGGNSRNARKMFASPSHPSIHGIRAIPDLHGATQRSGAHPFVDSCQSAVCLATAIIPGDSSESTE